MSTDLDAALRRADPLAHVSDTALAPALASARQVVERHRRPRRRAARWPRVLVLSGALAATAAVLTITVGPGSAGLVALGPADPGQRTAGLLPAAVAADGQMADEPVDQLVDRSYVARIAPADADLRLLPGHLPPGWAYESISAGAETETSWQVPPSLVATATDQDGVVTGVLTVVGPVQATVKTKGAVADVVDGHPALLFAGTQVPDAQSYQFPGRTWWWSDGRGAQWQATSENLSPDDADRAIEAVRTDGDQVIWKAPADSGLEIVHQRRGPAYPTTRTALRWNLTFTDVGGLRERELSIVRHDGADPLPVSAMRAVPGVQQSTLGGQGAALFPLGEGAGGGGLEEPVTDAGACRWEDHQISDGVTARLRACGDQDQITTLLASLTDVPADDPRLATYALDE